MKSILMKCILTFLVLMPTQTWASAYEYTYKVSVAQCSNAMLPEVKSGASKISKWVSELELDRPALDLYKEFHLFVAEYQNNHSSNRIDDLVSMLITTGGLDDASKNKLVKLKSAIRVFDLPVVENIGERQVRMLQELERQEALALPNNFPIGQQFDSGLAVDVGFYIHKIIVQFGNYLNENRYKMEAAGLESDKIEASLGEFFRIYRAEFMAASDLGISYSLENLLVLLTNARFPENNSKLALDFLNRYAKEYYQEVEIRDPSTEMIGRRLVGFVSELGDIKISLLTRKQAENILGIIKSEFGFHKIEDVREILMGINSGNGRFFVDKLRPLLHRIQSELGYKIDVTKFNINDLIGAIVFHKQESNMIQENLELLLEINNRLSPILFEKKI